MAKNSVFYKGTSYTIRLTITDQSGNPVDLDTIPNLIVGIYSEKTMKAIAEHTIDELTIDDPTTGIATFLMTGEETEAAVDHELYAAEYKYKVGEDKKGKKGHFAIAVPMKYQSEHFATS